MKSTDVILPGACSARLSMALAVLVGTCIAGDAKAGSGATPLLGPASNIALNLNVDAKKAGAAELISNTPAGKKVYVFFISTSEVYSREGTEAVVEALQKHFSAFGRDIGEDGVAMWVNEAGTSRLSARIGKLISDRYRLPAASDFDYSKGPYLVVTNVHPAQALREDFVQLPLPNDDLSKPFVAGISLRNISPVYVMDVLNSLEQGIRRANLTSRDMTRAEVWFTFKTWWDGNKQQVGEVTKEVFVAVLGTVVKKK